MDPKTYEQAKAIGESLKLQREAAAAKPAAPAPVAVTAPSVPQPAKKPKKPTLPKQTTPSAVSPVTVSAPDATKKAQFDADLLHDLKFDTLYRRAGGLPDIDAAIDRVSKDVGVDKKRYRELAAIQGVDLEDLDKNARGGMPFENYKKAKQGAIGFEAPTARTAKFDELYKDYTTAQKGEIRPEKRIDLAPAEEAPGTLGAFSTGYVMGGTKPEETAEVAKKGEHYYAVAQAYIDAVDADPESVKLVNLYGNRLASGATQQYINERAKMIMKNKGITPSSPDADRQANLARRQAMYDVLARKTVGQWTPGIFAKDVQVTDDAAPTENPFAALGPNVELIGFNSKGDAVFREESPAGMLLRTLDVVGVVPVPIPGKKILPIPIPGQSLMAGWMSRGENEGFWEAGARGVSTGANWVELALDATEGKPLPVRGAVGLASLAASAVHPDITAAAGSVSDMYKTLKIAKLNKDIVKESEPILKAYITALEKADYDTASDLEKQLAASPLLGRDQPHGVIKMFARADAAFNQALTSIDPTIVSQDPRLVDKLVTMAHRRDPALAEMVYEVGGVGTPYLHFSVAAKEMARHGKGGEIGESFETFLNASDFARRKQRVQLAREAFIKAVPQTAEEAIQKAADDIIEGMKERYTSAATMGVDDAKLARDKRVAEILEQNRADIIANPKDWMTDGKLLPLLAVDPATNKAADVAWRKTQEAIVAGLAANIEKLKTQNYQKLLADDMRIFDDMDRAIDTNIKSRMMAAESMRRTLADKAGLHITPIDILDEFVEAGTERLSPMAQAQFFGTMRQLPPEANRADFFKAFQILDAAKKTEAERYGIPLEEAWRRWRIDVKEGRAKAPMNVAPVEVKPPPVPTPPVAAPKAAAEAAETPVSAKALLSDVMAKLDPKLGATEAEVKKILAVVDSRMKGAPVPSKTIADIKPSVYQAVINYLVDQKILVRSEGKIIKLTEKVEKAPKTAKAALEPVAEATVKAEPEAAKPVEAVAEEVVEAAPAPVEAPEVMEAVEEALPTMPPRTKPIGPRRGWTKLSKEERSQILDLSRQIYEALAAGNMELALELRAKRDAVGAEKPRMPVMAEPGVKAVRPYEPELIRPEAEPVVITNIPELPPLPDAKLSKAEAKKAAAATRTAEREAKKAAAAEQKVIDQTAKAGLKKAPEQVNLHPDTTDVLADLDAGLLAKPQEVSGILTVIAKLPAGAEFPKSVGNFRKTVLGAIRDQMVKAGKVIEGKGKKFFIAGAEGQVEAGPTLKVVEKATETPVPAVMFEAAPEGAPVAAKKGRAPKVPKAAKAAPAPTISMPTPTAAPVPVGPAVKTIENLGDSRIWKKVKAPMKGVPESLETVVGGVKFRINAIPTSKGKPPEFRTVMQAGENIESLGGAFASQEDALRALAGADLQQTASTFSRAQVRPSGITAAEIAPTKVEEIVEEVPLPAVEEAIPAAPAAPAMTVEEKLAKVKEELSKITHSAFLEDNTQVLGSVDDQGNFVPRYEITSNEARGGGAAEALYNKVLSGAVSPLEPQPAAKYAARAASAEQFVKKMEKLADEGELYQIGVTAEGEKVTKGGIKFMSDADRARLRDQDGPVAIITLFRNEADPTTLLHEAGHYIRKMVLTQEDMDAVTRWTRAKGVNVSHKYGEFQGAAADIRKAEEMFAQAFEEYLAKGKAPEVQLQTLFEKMKDVFAKVYRTITKGPLGKEVDDDVKAVFDRLFTSVPDKKPESTFDIIMRQTFNNKGLEQEGGLTAIAREAKRRGIPKASVEELAKLVAAAAKKHGDDWETEVVLDFPAPVLGKEKWTGKDITDLSQKIQGRRNEFEMAPLKQALFGEPEETQATEQIYTALSEREESEPAAAARWMARGLAKSIIGGDVVKENGLRNLVPEIRRDLDTMPRIIGQAINDSISVLSEVIKSGDPTFLYKFLAGDTALKYTSGRRVISSGHEFIAGFMDLFRNAGAALSEDELAALQDFAKAINTRPDLKNLQLPQQRSEAVAAVVYPDLASITDETIQKSMRARANLIAGAIDKFRNLKAGDPTSDKEIGSQLSKALRGVTKEGTQPSINEYRFTESLLYLAGITPRNGEMFVEVGADYANTQLQRAAQTLIEDTQNIFGAENGQLAARRLSILIGAYGSAARAKAELAGLGLVLTKEEAFAYNHWALGYGVTPEMRVRLEGLMRKFGANTQFEADTILGANVYIPVQARKRIADMLGKAQFSEQKLTPVGDLYLSVYSFMKKRMTRGNFVLRQRYFMVNTIDHFFQMSLIVGYGPALQSMARVSLQNAMASLLGQTFETVVRAASFATNGRLSPAYVENVRDWLSQGGDATAYWLRRMMSDSKYRVEVNDVLEGSNRPIILGGHVTTAKRLREMFVAEGILEAYNTRRLGQVIREEGSAFLRDGDGFVSAGIDDRSLAGNVATGWAKYKNAAFDILGAEMRIVDDIGDAWAERERVGAAVTLIENGIEPRLACRLTVDALYDYGQSMTKMDRNWLVGLIFPFWAFQKNANQQFVNVLATPYGAYRMMVLKRFRDRGGELLTELYYDAVGGELGLDVNSMPQDMQDMYYAIMTKAHEVYGDEIPDDAKLALRMALTGRTGEVVDGKYYELDARLIQMLRAGGIAGVGAVGMSEYLLPKPSRAGLPSYIRDRPGVFLAQERNAQVRLFTALSGRNDQQFFLMMPEASFETAMKHTATVLSTAVLMGGYASAMTPAGPLLKKMGVIDETLTERGLEGVDVLQAIKPVIDLERSPIAGPVIGLYAKRGYPQRVHPLIASVMMNFTDVPLLRVPAQMDPFENDNFVLDLAQPGPDGQPKDITQILGEDKIRTIQELNSQELDPRSLSTIKNERFYLPPGGYSIAFENSPLLGEFNKELLLKYDAGVAYMLEGKASPEMADTTGRLMYALRNLTGLDVATVSPSQTAQQEEPVFYTKSKKPF